MTAWPEAGLRPREIQGWPERTKGARITWKGMHLKEILMGCPAW